MQYSQKLWLLVAISLIAAGLTFLFPPVPQPPAFHEFADGRNVFGIHNFLNVASNLPFVIVGFYGFSLLWKSNVSLTIHILFSVLFLEV